ncbi:hypothetical protein HHK36_009776 [Tetracentron sinense]|uniref:Btz domain-containing protein n=1 Tax=Tetracentron sinense TaxID=13715 RepID=A0A835DIN2_TETSI|nr:hypothetical protein HHK36_009776 [Tetracentron sinense]
MPRRETRESETKRHHERESSLKRSRRDGKLATKRTSNNHNFNSGGLADRDQKHHRRLQGALPLEAPLAPDSKIGIELDKKTDELHNGTKHSSDPTEVPRPQSYLQHNEHGSAGQGGGSFIRRTTERGWWRDSKDQSGDKSVGKRGPHDMEQRNERAQAGVDDKNIWRHDGFLELEAEAPPPARNWPAFREKKMSVDSGNAGMEVMESARLHNLDCPSSRSKIREERGGHNSRDLDRPFTGDQAPIHRGTEQRVGFPSRERFGSGGSFRGRDRFTGRNGERNQYPLHVEKWKHDLFDEANTSLTSKNEDDQIAKVEALLAL